ncbi:MAG TPA: inorganic phosphate transporter [Lysobacter sp.]|jgi:PiT family inorganic phosphate transporter|nr:inorganic phosphate transporter [Lysobacter sp.]
MTLSLLLLVVLTLAAANGANDNIKGAATLIGSGLTDYRRAIAWATLATAVGGAVSLFAANGLLQAFGGRGIVPDVIAGSPGFLGTVGLGAGATVWLATRLGLPVSTTHALLGSLLGAGLAAAPQEVGFAVALRSMLGPLLVAPAIAIVFALALVPLLRTLRARNAIEPACLCAEPAVPAIDGTSAARARLHLGRRSDRACQAPAVEIAGFDLSRFSPSRLLDRAHYLSALSVSFARGLNDTPKIAALLVVTGGLGAAPATVAVIVAMALGAGLAAHRVADTLAYRITRMDPAEGLGGNLVTAGLVLVASRYGLPVSTTHVSTGALFGIAAGNHSGRRAVILNILGAWLLTLPLAAALAAAVYAALSRAPLS